MEETGLSKQLPERESSDGYTNQDQFDPAFSSTGDNDNFEKNANISDMRYSSESTTKNMNNIPSQKKSTLDSIKEKIPPLPLLRVSVKASIAILISFIFVLNGRCRAAMGAAILVPIGTIFSFPVRPIGRLR
jgi:hypothetical protein